MVISYQKTLNTFVVVNKTQSPKAYLGVFIMPFDCVGVTMHIEGASLSETVSAPQSPYLMP